MHTYIIAEAGVNHNGDIRIAKRLIDVAVEAGCDAVKFQTFNAKKLVTRLARKAKYQIENTKENSSQYEMLKKLELDVEDHKELIRYCKEKDIEFLSTPFDEDSADLLDDLGMKTFKIPSGEIVNKPFLQHIAKKHKPMIVSTGMCTLGEVEEALQWIYEMGNDNITLLHCTTNYPTAPQEVNLQAMLTMGQAFQVKVGYSDHTLGIEVPTAAVALGARIIEKHFTIDKNMDGPDHKASLEPHELIEMVKAIRNIELALGNGIKQPTSIEMENRVAARKSIVLEEDLKQGTVLTKEKITMKRPGNGLPPKLIDLIIGKKAVRDLQKDELVQLSDFI